LENKFNIKAVVLIIILILMVFCEGGCSDEYVIGGYNHVDMSKSPYKPLILEQANKLAISVRSEDWRTAARYYGSIKMLDEMDKCIFKYVEMEPKMGLYLLEVGRRIRKYYDE